MAVPYLRGCPIEADACLEALGTAPVEVMTSARAHTAHVSAMRVCRKTECGRVQAAVLRGCPSVLVVTSYGRAGGKARRDERTV